MDLSKPSAGAIPVKLKPRTSAKSVLGKADRAQRARDRLPRSTAAGDDTLRNRIEPMEEEGAVGELEEEEEGAVDEWEEEGAVDIVVSDSEEELEVQPWVLRQPNLIQKLADVVTQRASCVLELEGGAQLTLRPAPQRRRPPPPTKHLLYYPVPGWLTLTPPAPLSPDHARDSTITVAVLVLNVAARL